MTEEVSTGGTKKFVRPKGYKVERDPELEKSIDEAYKQAEERKRRERRNKIIIISITLLLLIAATITIVLLT